MVAERSGTVRVFNAESLKPVYSLSCLSMGKDAKYLGYPLLSFDWCQSNPEIIIASTASDIYLWNTANSW
jgi:hypothetical protein